jgi:NADPH2:quinone reductase
VGNVAAYRTASTALFEMIAKGEVKIKLARTFQLAEAALAHLTLESRGTTGKLLLEAVS